MEQIQSDAYQVARRKQTVGTATMSNNLQNEASIDELLDYQRNKAPLLAIRSKRRTKALSYKSRVALGSDPEQEIGRSLHIGLRSQLPSLLRVSAVHHGVLWQRFSL